MPKASHTLFAAFQNAFKGIYQFFRTERNGQIELACATIILSLAYFFHCNTNEWLIILLCIALVFCAEMMNSAIEKLCDTLHPEIHVNIKFVKDVSAGAVLVCSIISVVIALIIFLPKIC